MQIRETGNREEELKGQARSSGVGMGVTIVVLVQRMTIYGERGSDSRGDRLSAPLLTSCVVWVSCLTPLSISLSICEI